MAMKFRGSLQLGVRRTYFATICRSCFINIHQTAYEFPVYFGIIDTIVRQAIIEMVKITLFGICFKLLTLFIRYLYFTQSPCHLFLVTILFCLSRCLVRLLILLSYQGLSLGITITCLDGIHTDVISNSLLVKRSQLSLMSELSKKFQLSVIIRRLSSLKSAGS